MAGFRGLLMLCDDLVKPLIPLYQKYSLVSPRTLPEREHLFSSDQLFIWNKTSTLIFKKHTVQRWRAVIISTSRENIIFAQKKRSHSASRCCVQRLNSCPCSSSPSWAQRRVLTAAAASTPLIWLTASQES